MKKAGIVDAPKRGELRITDLGEQLLLEDQIDDVLGETGLGKVYIKLETNFKYDFMNNDKVPN